MACFPGRPAQGVSEARAAVRGRQETGWYRVFKRDDSGDELARAVRSGAAHDGATEEMTGCADSDVGHSIHNANGHLAVSPKYSSMPQLELGIPRKLPNWQCQSIECQQNPPNLRLKHIDIGPIGPI